MKRCLFIAAFVVAGIGLGTYLVANNAKGGIRQVLPQLTFEAKKCLAAAFNPQIFSLHGKAISLLQDLDQLGDHHSGRRVFAVLLESHDKIDVFLVTNEPDSTISVLHFAGDRAAAPNLLARVQQQLFENQGIACAGALTQSLVEEKLSLVNKGAFRSPVSPQAILRHELRDRGQAYLRLSLICLC